MLFLVGELGARVAGFGTASRFLETRSHEFLQMVPLPDQQQLVGLDDPSTGELPVPMRINAYGQRGADYPLEKAPGELRIIGLGDSLTFGRGVGTDETYLARLGVDFAAHPPLQPVGAEVRVINAAFNGYGSYHYEQWARSQFERFQPDLLLIGLYSGNDMEPVAPYQHGALFDLLRQSALRRMLIAGYNQYLWKRVRAWKQGRTLEQVEGDLEAYRGTGSGETRRALAEAQWAVSMEHLRGIREVAAAHGIPAVCILIPTAWMTVSEEQPPFYTWLREQVAETGLPVIDLMGDLRAEHPTDRSKPGVPTTNSAWLSFDAGHLSVEGHGTVARTVRQGLADLGLVE